MIVILFPFLGLQQIRWSPVNIADSPKEALSRLFMLPGATYVNPGFSWKFEVAPAGIGFVKGGALGPQLEGNLSWARRGMRFRAANFFACDLPETAKR